VRACRGATRECRRLTRNYCDYDPAHKAARVQVLVRGHLWGQSCVRHALALGMDALETGEPFEFRLRSLRESARVLNASRGIGQVALVCESEGHPPPAGSWSPESVGFRMRGARVVVLVEGSLSLDTGGYRHEYQAV
jgi:hypothetical protein